MAKLTTDELLDAFKEMTLIELSEFVKLFEDTFGVTAAAPVAVAAAPAAAGGDAALVALGVLGDDELVAADGERALGEHDVAGEDVDLVLVVHRDLVGFDADRLGAVGLFGVGRRCGEQGDDGGEEGDLPECCFHGFGTRRFR